MKTDNFVSTLAYLVKRLGGAEIVILVVTGLLCWLFNWRSLIDYSTGLKWAGLIVMSVGLFSFLGGASLGTDISFQYGKTVMPNTMQERAQQNVADMAASMSFTTWAGIVGVITITLGFILRAFVA